MPHDHVPVERLGVAESDKSALPTVLPAAGEGADDLDIAGIALAARANVARVHTSGCLRKRILTEEFLLPGKECSVCLKSFFLFSHKNMLPEAGASPVQRCDRRVP